MDDKKGVVSVDVSLVQEHARTSSTRERLAGSDPRQPNCSRFDGALQVTIAYQSHQLSLGVRAICVTRHGSSFGVMPVVVAEELLARSTRRLM
jgi:hypothetical protein